MCRGRKDDTSHIFTVPLWFADTSVYELIGPLDRCYPGFVARQQHNN